MRMLPKMRWDVRRRGGRQGTAGKHECGWNEPRKGKVFAKAMTENGPFRRLARVNGGRIKAVCVSPDKHTQKEAVERVVLVPERGIDGDAHYGFGHRQVSLLADESVDKMREKGREGLKPGAFGENLINRGMDLL